MPALLLLAVAALWWDPGPIESLDLAAGPGGTQRAPQPPFTFEKEELAGTSPKIVVRDGRGARWMVKFGPEVKGETFATRFAWAAGYITEPTYYVREGQIEGAGNLGRAAQFVQNGRFTDARFELRDPSVYRVVPGKTWSFGDRDLKDTKELSGLKLVVMLVSNWDIKPENLAVVEAGGRQHNAITDWGASMGRAGDFSYRSKWDCAAYSEQTQHWIDGAGDGYVSFNYAGKQRDQITQGIRVEHVKWFMDRMSKLSDAQIRAGLAASGAAAEETGCFAAALGRRLGQLVTAASATDDGSAVIRSRTVRKTVTRTQQ